MNWFQQTSRLGDAWFSVGLASSFPDIGIDEIDGDLSQPRLCDADHKPGCKVFYVPVTNSPDRKEVSLASEDASEGADLKDQVLVFQYRGKFHAIDHVSALPARDRESANRAHGKVRDVLIHLILYRRVHHLTSRTLVLP
jgi:hypothetical protein